MAVWPDAVHADPAEQQLPAVQLQRRTDRGHPLGFTFQGCDIYARTVWGARTSLSVGLLATLIGSVIGLIMGALAGFYGGWLDGCCRASATSSSRSPTSSRPSS
jgi:oligopeptide transport system permease protein